MLVFIFSCKQDTKPLYEDSVSGVKDSVQQMMSFMAKDVTLKGPIAWLHYFEDTSAFFMASEGELAFPNYDSAQQVINRVLVKSIRKIDLHWSGIRINPLTATSASIAATFHENITDFEGRTSTVDGYFTAIANQTLQGWKLLNAHWSTTAAH